MRAALAREPLHVLGRLPDASNVAMLVRVGEAGLHAIYKPVLGETPLWDFPDGDLAGREVATALIDAAGGWGLVPPTVRRDGPHGTGSVQEWVTDPPAPDGTLASDDPGVVGIFARDDVPPQWRAVVQAEDEDGNPLLLAHADDPALRSLSVLDAVLNNSDRKGSHLLRGRDGRLWGIDHGVTLHTEPKLRTVLWGWAGEPLTDEDREHLERLADALTGPGDLPDRLHALLTAPEVEALTDRVHRLLAHGRHPQPDPGWPPLPWPAL